MWRRWRARRCRGGRTAQPAGGGAVAVAAGWGPAAPSYPPLGQIAPARPAHQSPRFPGQRSWWWQRGQAGPPISGAKRRMGVPDGGCQRKTWWGWPQPSSSWLGTHHWWRPHCCWWLVLVLAPALVVQGVRQAAQKRASWRRRRREQGPAGRRLVRAGRGWRRGRELTVAAAAARWSC